MKLKLLFFVLISVFSMQARDGFSNKPASFTFPNVGIVGTITGWGSNPDIAMTTNDGINYSASNVMFMSNEQMKFRQDESWAVNWGAMQFPSGTAVLGSPDNISVPSGSYDISFNFQTGAYSFTLLPSEFPVIGLIGEFNGWSESVNMQTIDGVVYTLSDYYFPAPGNDSGLKFRQDNGWEINWGGTSFPSGTAILGGNNNIPVLQGFYNVSFNLNTLEYDFEPVLMSIIGTADVDFDTDTAMMTADGLTHTLSNVTLSTGLLKFRTVGSWSVNFGSPSFPSGIGVNNGDNIQVTAGVYDISFNRLTGAYSFVLSSSPFPVIGLIGEFNGWSESVNMFTEDGENYILASVYFPAPGGDPGAKFRQDNAWTINWGGASFPSGTAISGGQNNIPVQQGFYSVSFNLTTLAYNFEPILFGITGTADIDFGIDTVMDTEDGITHTLNNQVLSDGLLKFRTAGSWDINFGSDTFPMGVGVSNGVNIPITAGVYNITFNRLTGAYNFALAAQMANSSCNSTLASAGLDFVFANEIANATQYEFKLVNGTNEQTVVKPTNSFRFADLGLNGFVYGTTYDVSVRAEINSVWTAYSESCPITIAANPVSEMDGFCNLTMPNINSKIYFDLVLQATEYRYSVTNVSTNEEQFVTTNIRFFYITDISNYAFGTNYSIKCQVKIDGTFGEFGPACTLTTPAAPPSSQLRPAYCNTTLTSLNANIYANFVVGASMYKFKVVNGTNEQEIERPDSRFSMAFASGIMAGTSYDVSVAVMINGVWGPYGNVCTIETPVALPTSQLRPQFCGGTVTSLGSNFYAVFRSGATAYKFKTMINGEDVEVVRPDSRCFMSAFAGAMANQTYSIQVAVQIGGVWSEFGNACNLTVGSIVNKQNVLQITETFDIKAYPNPFVNQITLSLSNENTQSDIMVYDMTGKLIQQVSTEQTSLEIGNDWSKGIYLVQIVQGQETKNIRIVKQ